MQKIKLLKIVHHWLRAFHECSESQTFSCKHFLQHWVISLFGLESLKG